jgi:peroxiredoxin
VGATLAGTLALQACVRGGRAAATWERPGLGGAIRPEMGPPQPGDDAPDLDLPSAVGPTRVRLASLRGSWVLMHFTATWCPYCDAEVAGLGELADAFEARGVRVLLVDVKEEPALFGAYARDHVAESVESVIDPDGVVATRWAPPRAQPSFTDRSQVMFDSTVIVDPVGKIRLFLFPDTAHFDPTFRAVREDLDRMLTESGRPEPPLRPAEEVVSIAAAAPSVVDRGAGASVVVDLDVAPGYHVMAASPDRATYVPTVVRLDSGDGIAAAGAAYPAPKRFHFGGRTILTFRGTTRVTVPVHVAPDVAAGKRTLRGTVRYQACTSSRCLMPVTKPLEVAVTVGG